MVNSKLVGIFALGACAVALQNQNTHVQELEELRIVRSGKLCARVTGDENGGVIEVMGAQQQPALIIRSSNGGAEISAKSEDGNTTMLWFANGQYVGQSMVAGDHFISDSIDLHDKSDKKVSRVASAASNNFNLTLADKESTCRMRSGRASCMLKIVSAIIECSAQSDLMMIGKLMLGKEGDGQQITAGGTLGEKFAIESSMGDSAKSWELKFKR